MGDVPAFERDRLVRTLMAANRLYGRGFHRLDVLTPPSLPDIGPCLVAANHASGLDPVLIQSVLARPVAWLVTSDYYDLPVLRQFLSRIGCVRVDRTKPDTDSVKQALRTLKAGRVVGIFPEGRIERTSHLLPLREGAGRLAAQTGCPVLPAWVDGDVRPRPGVDSTVTGVYLQPRRVAVAFGEPIDPPGRRDRGFNDRLRGALADLRRLTRRPAPGT